MTKKFFYSLSALFLLFCTAVAAQNIPVIAYVNTAELIDAVPEKAQATEKLTSLSESYKAELQLLQNEYNKKYSDFITYQTSLAENIKLRRMQELTNLENQMQEFIKIKL